MVLALASGCTSDLRQVRRLIARGDVAAAAEAVSESDDRYALQEVALEILARGLAGSDEALQERAASGLAGGGGLSRPRLRELAGDEAHPVAAALAAEALASLGDRRMANRLRSKLGDADPVIRAAAVRAVGTTREPARFFEGALGDPDSRVRAAGVSAVARRRDDPDSSDLLAQVALRDPEPGVRAAALRALSRIERGERLLETAREVLAVGDAPLPLRLAAIQALGAVDDVNAAEVLLLEVLSGGDPQERLRAAAILSTYGNEAGHEYLRSALADPSVSIAGGAAIAAGGVGGPLRDALVQALHRPEPEVRLHVASSLLHLGERELAMAELARLVEQPGWVGLQAALAMDRGDDETSQAAIRLAAALEDPSVELRSFAALSCGFIDDGWEIAARGLSDADASVRIAAATSVLRSLVRGG
jgi:HEAT repeat protein